MLYKGHTTEPKSKEKKGNLMNKSLIVVCIKNMAVMLCFTALAIAFEKWWIVLFCGFFMTIYEGKISYKEDRE